MADVKDGLGCCQKRVRQLEQIRMSTITTGALLLEIVIITRSEAVSSHVITLF